MSTRPCVSHSLLGILLIRPFDTLFSFLLPRFASSFHAVSCAALRDVSRYADQSLFGEKGRVVCSSRSDFQFIPLHLKDVVF